MVGLCQRCQHGALAARCTGQRATVTETAALRPGIGARHLALDGAQHRLALPVEPGHGGQQQSGVGVGRRGKNLLHRAAFHHPPAVHHGHVIGHVGHHAHVVGDQHNGGADLVAQALHQVQNLRLDGHVQRRGWLIGDQQAGPAHQGCGDHDALAHATRQLKRELRGAQGRVGNPHHGQHSNGLLPRLLTRQAAVDAQRLLHLGAYAHQRVERRHRLLENDGGAIATDLPQLGLIHRGEFGAFKVNLATGDLRRPRQQLQDRQRR